MAEVLASLASSVALIETSAKILSRIYVYMSKVKEADSTFQRLSIEVAAVNGLMSQLRLQVIEGGASYQQNALGGLGDEVLSWCQRDLSFIEEVVRKYDLKMEQAPISASRKLTWPLKEMSVRKVMYDIGRIQTLISNALNVETATAVAEIKKDCGAIRKAIDREGLLNWLCPVNVSTNDNYTAALLATGSKGPKVFGNWLVSSADS
jgi:hypothetical protein